MTPCPFPENASTQLAEEVPGIDAILVGHAHLEIPERFVTNKATGKQVLLTEPLKWGMRVSVMDLGPRQGKGQWSVTSAHSHLLDAKTVDADPAVVRAVQAGHEATVKYVNEVIGTSTAPLSTAHRLLGGLRRDRRHQLRPGQHHQGRAGQRSRGGAARPVHRGGVLPAQSTSRPGR